MDKESFSRFIEREGASIYSFCLYLCHRRDIADDIYQEACLAAWERHEEIDCQLNPKAFILSLANSKWKNIWRKRARRQKILPLGSLEESIEENGDLGARIPGRTTELNAEELYIQSEAHASLHRSLGQLDVKYRLPILMHYTGGLTYAEIAKAMNLPLGTVKRRIFEAKQRLKALIEEEMEGKANYVEK